MSTERRIYRNLVMRKYEEVRSLISQYFNHFTLVSDIDSSLLKEEGDYLSLLSLSGLSISNEEFKARKVSSCEDMGYDTSFWTYKRAGDTL